MRYRRLDYRYTMVRFSTWPLGQISWASGIASPYLEEARWLARTEAVVIRARATRSRAIARGRRDQARAAREAARLGLR